MVRSSKNRKRSNTHVSLLYLLHPCHHILFWDISTEKTFRHDSLMQATLHVLYQAFNVSSQTISTARACHKASHVHHKHDMPRNGFAFHTVAVSFPDHLKQVPFPDHLKLVSFRNHSNLVPFPDHSNSVSFPGHSILVPFPGHPV